MVVYEKSSKGTVAGKLKRIFLSNLSKDTVKDLALFFCLLQVKLGLAGTIHKIEITKNSVDKSFRGSSQQNSAVL